MNKSVTSLTLALVTTLGLTAQAGFCDESVSTAKQAAVTENPDGSTTASSAEQTEVKRNTSVPATTTTSTRTDTVRPLPVKKVTKTKQSTSVSTAPAGGYQSTTTTVNTH